MPKVDRVTLESSRLLAHLSSHHHDVLVFGPGYSVKTLHSFAVLRSWDFPLGLYRGLRFNMFSPDLMHAAAAAAVSVTRSASAAEDLVSRGFDDAKFETWNGGVNSYFFHPDKPSKSLREQWGANGGKSILLYVGRASREKNLGALADAYGLLDRTNKVQLVIVGDGPAMREFEALLSSMGLAAIFAGFLSGEGLARAYASADTFVFPSVLETHRIRGEQPPGGRS